MGLVHGRLKDKDEVMRTFVSGDVQVLVATAVVEVGVDVPNATVMMIEGADRFGLAQLHQFRGRVGRGADQSYCLLLAEESTEVSRHRLELVARIQDGLKLAQEDMELRGVGEFMGSRQHGQLSDPAMEALRNPKLLDEVRDEVQELASSDPGFEHQPTLRAAAERLQNEMSVS